MMCGMGRAVLFDMKETITSLSVLRNQLVGRIHTEDVRRIVDSMAYDDGDVIVKALYHLLSDTDQRIAYNAAWVLSCSDGKVIKFLIRYQNQLIDLLIGTKDKSFARILFSILRRQTFEKNNLRTDFLDFCLNEIVNSNQAIAIRVHAIYVSYSLCKAYPELLNELFMTLQMLESETLSAGLLHARNTIMSAIKKK
ncbi:MAG: hypothetical protein HXL34_03275 [Prevotellaceae bacterium]|nr:hypothetical protein [Prevotellaceae bacterium]